MHVSRLSLRDFRTYRALALDLPPGPVVLHGPNGAGKTNLLEGLVFACTGASFRAHGEEEVIRWDAEWALARADIERPGDSALRLDVAVGRPGGGRLVRQIKVNGARKPRRADLLGLAPVALFSVEDIEMVKGDAAVRRDFLNHEIAVDSRGYYWTLTRYGRALEQRNRLLKEIREGRGRPADLAPWEEQLGRHGAVLVLKRSDFFARLQPAATAALQELTGRRTELEVIYRPALGAARDSLDAARGAAFPSAEAVMETMRQEFAVRRDEESARGYTLTGPHRDDFTVLLGGREARVYGSQGEQRSAAIALRLGRYRLLTEARGDPPLLLLDDVLSELDSTRRDGLFRAAAGAAQVIITTVEPGSIPEPWRKQARRGRVSPGQVEWE